MDQNMALVLRPFSVTTRVSQYQNVCILDFIGATDDGDAADNWSCKVWRASPPTNQHPVDQEIVYDHR